LRDTIYIQTVQSRGHDGALGTPACVSRGADVSPSVETLHFLLEWNKPRNSIMLA
jgi:hypothetical protein